MLCFLTFGAIGALAETLTLDQIQSRINALSESSSSSASGHFIVVGTNRLENLSLIGWCEDAKGRIATVTGLPVPFKQRTIRFIVREDCTDAPGGVAVRHAQVGASLVHRIYLRDYDAAYSRRGRQAHCHAILAGYVASSLDTILELPPWLWKGLEQNVLFGVRASNMEQALARWRQGSLSSVWSIIGAETDSSRDDGDGNEERLVDYGAFVHWLTSLPERRKRFKAIFARIAAGKPVSVVSLAKLIPAVDGDTGIDEAWDRWLAQQEHVVFLPGTVSTRIMDQLRAELFLHPGTAAIPLDAGLPRAATVGDFVPHRKATWITAAVRDKRSRLDLLAVGRATVFRELISEFDEFLSGLESDAPDTLLLDRLTAAYTAMGILADRVEASGGLLHEEETPDAREQQNRSEEP